MKYYSVTRPILPGGYPREANVLKIQNFETPVMCQNLGRTVWGIIEFNVALSLEEAAAYELIADQKKEFWSVKSSVNSNGDVEAQIVGPVLAIMKPEDICYVEGQTDIYVEYFEDFASAESFQETIV